MYKEHQDYCLKILPEILKSEGVAGNCSHTIELLEKYLADLGLSEYASKTNKGALIVKLPGRDKSKTRVLSAHADTLGAMVKSISGSGRVNLVPVGGADAFSIDGEYVTIVTAENKRIRGTVLHNNPSAHVNKDVHTDARTYKNISVRLDEKVSSKDEVEKLGISVGDFCFFDPRVEITESGFIKSRHLDDKAGVAAMYAALNYLKDKNIEETLPYNTWFYFSIGEEVGNGLVSGLPKDCFEVVAIDMGALGDGQESDEFTVSICAKDSSGPFDYQLRTKIVNIAKENKIPYKVDIYPYYGSDAAAALRTGIDARHMLFGPGIDASHSYERVHRDSMDATVSLIIKYIEVE